MVTVNPGLPTSNLIKVGVTVTPNGAKFENFNTLLLLGSTAVIDPVERMRVYESLAGVGGDFSTSDPEYLAAELWFGQSPSPNTLNIGRWVKTDAPGELVCGGVQAADELTSAWTGITTGSFGVYLDGVPKAITGLNFSAITSLNGVAAVIQTALNSAESGTTCTYFSNTNNFVIESGTTGTSSSVSFITAPTAVGDYVFAGQPSNNDTITIDGTLITFVSGTPSGSQVKIGGSLTITLASLLTFLDASADVNLVLMTYSVTGSTLYVRSILSGTAGNAYTLAKSGTNISISGSTLTGGSGTDISAMLSGLSTSSGAYVVPGQLAETALAAVQLFDNQFSGQWYGLYTLGTSDSDVLNIAAYVEAATNPPHSFFVTTQEAGAYSSVSTSDLPYLLKQLKYNKTEISYSSTNPYAFISSAAYILTTNWSGSKTAKAIMYSTQPGVVAETLTVTQQAVLKSKNCSVYINYANGTSIVQYGATCGGQFIDTMIGIDWFVNTIQINEFNILYEAAGAGSKIPQTDQGMHTLGTGIVAACAQAVTNGFAAPGVWNSPGFGQIVEGQFLPKGYYIYQPPVSSQPETDRQRRISVPYQVALKLAGAVAEVNISAVVNQ